MTISISSPAQNAVVSGNSVSISGTSVQKVDSVALAAQPWTETWDISALSAGAISKTFSNSSGDSVTLNLTKQATQSPNGATITDTTGLGTGVVSGALIDASGNSWTLHNDPTYGNVVYENGSQFGNTDHVVTLLYYNSAFYVLGNDGNWYGYSAGAWNELPGGTDPRTSPPVHFWSMNGHITWGSQYQNWSGQITKLLDLNMKTYRNGYALGDYTSFLNFINNNASAAGVTVYPVLLPDPTLQADETAAYNTGHTLGVEVATNLAGKVVAYDIANETGAWALLGGQYNGDIPSHYDNTRYTIARGLIRGAIAGIKSVDTTTLIVAPSDNWLHTGFSDMLVNGTQPDGTTGHPTVTWDITGWHWYSDMGNIEDAGTINMNVLAKLQSYGKPIWITEYGVRPTYGTESAIGTYLTGTMMTEWYTKAATYGITHVAMYDLFDDANLGSDGNYGVVQSNGTTNKGRYAGVKSYIASNPK